MGRRVSIIDYGVGNLGSLSNAFNHLSASVEVVSTPEGVAKAELVVLPGVGAFAPAMTKLKEREMHFAISEAAACEQIIVFGICLGMQLLGISSTEEGETLGLGLVPVKTTRFDRDTTKKLKIPHVGFNEVINNSCSRLFSRIPQAADFYFNHSYRVTGLGSSYRFATCDHGGQFVAALEYQNIVGVQFHPEKSQQNGLTLLKNIIDLT